MIDREQIEKREELILSKYATLSKNTKGRTIEEEKCPIRTDFQRDRDRIVHSKAFRRLMHKTQVFLSLEGDHFRTRLTHTLEVAQVSRTIARALGLNEDLTEAIALGHDLGHTPFGHGGEKVLNAVHKKGFKHNYQSLRVVDVLEIENKRRGMNLTAEVRNGIVCHTGKVNPFTLEGQIVKISDRIAYINHDIDDAIRTGIIKGEDLPKDSVKVLGGSRRSRINTLIQDVISESWDRPEIKQSSEAFEAMDRLRDFMFDNVYYNTKVKKDSDVERVEKIIKDFYNYYRTDPKKLPQELYDMIDEFGVEEMAKDYIAGMTDRYAINLYNKLFL